MALAHRKDRVLPTSSGPIRLRPRRTELIGTQFDGTQHSARVIGAWLGRDTKIVDGILFTVIGDAPRPDQSSTGSPGDAGWCDTPIRLSPPRPTTRSAHTTNRYRQLTATPNALTTLIVNQWQQAHRGADDFEIASEEELFGYLLHIFTHRRGTALRTKPLRTDESRRGRAAGEIIGRGRLSQVEGGWMLRCRRRCPSRSTTLFAPTAVAM